MSDITKEAIEPFWNKDAGLLARIADLESQLASLKLGPLSNDDAPGDRDWTDVEWARNQWWLAIDFGQACEREIAEKDKEIERMQFVIDAVRRVVHNGVDPIAIVAALQRYEQSTKPLV